ncbi:hypothetical protein DPSP01_014609 [Paraphaeosphaeria sporulosa]
MNHKRLRGGDQSRERRRELVRRYPPTAVEVWLEAEDSHSAQQGALVLVVRQGMVEQGDLETQAPRFQPFFPSYVLRARCLLE